MSLRRRLIPRRPRPSALPAPQPFPCEGAVAWAPTSGPLVTELLAARAHTGRLPALGAVQWQYADEYQLLARWVIRDLWLGYLAATRGTGSFENLLTNELRAHLDLQDAPAPRTAPEVPWWSAAPGYDHPDITEDDPGLDIDQRPAA
ncbi:hypothetical protein [Streptomyces sp. WM6378]|uniref:hypothetical protein n=1 Tax=Streptomyces sp. WM6378 TaxID=1415557 RepID=UPI0006AF4CBB|nr:hypothetical protein [Streptomyces sp. WM6378]KOU37627.1 hypothetical protein ADK54_31440 [Streptomyces sp. WM6378]